MSQKNKINIIGNKIISTIGQKILPITNNKISSNIRYSTINKPKINFKSESEFPKNFALSYLLKNTFTKYPLDHSFDMNQVELFLEKIDPNMKDICKKIIDNTDHISFELFLTHLNINIKELLKIVNKDRGIFIYIDTSDPNYKTKSNYWLYTYIIQYITSISKETIHINKIDSIESMILQDDDIIVFIDDCIYSGEQMGTTISKCINSNNLKLNFYILVPFISSFGKQTIISSLKEDNITIIFPTQKFKIKSIIDVLSDAEFIKFQNYYQTSRRFVSKNHYLIYFDHKLADNMSTITPFYLGVIPNKNSSSETIIPIIKNCKYYTKNLKYSNPECPAPPYKSNFNEFIKNTKKLKKYRSLSNRTLSNNKLPINRKSF
jgi:hypothetical protein